jgi:hypothetical protein
MKMKGKNCFYHLMVTLKRDGRSGSEEG